MLKTPASAIVAQSRACFHAPGEERHPCRGQVSLMIQSPIPWREVRDKQDQAGVDFTSLDLSPQIWSPGTGAWAARPCAWRASSSCLMAPRCGTTTCTACTDGLRPDPHTSESSTTFSSRDSLQGQPGTDEATLLVLSFPLPRVKKTLIIALSQFSFIKYSWARSQTLWS